MNTEIIRIDFDKNLEKQLSLPSQILKNGGVVAFPTETVYGLGANALDKDAISKIFKAKNRPNDNPLIVHISDISELENIAKNIDERAKKLIDLFWPGPLTLILEKHENIPYEVTANLDFVGVRMPSNEVANKLIKLSGVPIVAPSANLSGKPSTCKFNHVFDDMNQKIDCIIDGGEVEIGVESTVVDVTKNPAVILRPGKVSFEELSIVIDVIESNNKSNAPKAPGMKYKHYSPNAKIYTFLTDEERDLIMSDFIKKRIKILEYDDDISMAKELFTDFRKADDENFEIILVKEIRNGNLSKAILDRLYKAAENK